jgi:hypothetical protein
MAAVNGPADDPLPVERIVGPNVIRRDGPVRAGCGESRKSGSSGGRTQQWVRPTHPRRLCWPGCVRGSLALSSEAVACSARRSSPTQQPRTSTATTISSAAGGHPGHHDFKVNLQARDQGPSTSPRIPAQPDVPTFRAPARRGRGRYCTIGAKRAATRLVTVSVARTRDTCRSGGRPSLGPTSASPARTPVAPDRP